MVLGYENELGIEFFFLPMILIFLLLVRECCMWGILGYLMINELIFACDCFIVSCILFAEKFEGRIPVLEGMLVMVMLGRVKWKLV